jgi:hypothetical protein
MLKPTTMILVCAAMAFAQSAAQKVENDYVRASLGSAAPGKKGPMHRHQ